MKAAISTTLASLVLVLAMGEYGKAALFPKPDPIAPPPVGSYAAETRRPVDLVICLDTSGSMTQLIDSARARLWDVVNELAAARPMPILRVGLLTYGSPSNSARDSGWIVRQCDLTSDLDTVYEKMMGMKTNGGREYVGWVLNDAVEQMSWSSAPNALKIVFVAGNESADQAVERYNFRYVAERAAARDIVINAIYAGNEQQGEQLAWGEVARHGRGQYAAIDMNAGTIQLATPHDEVLEELNAKLNATYVPYGEQGQTGRDNQVRQDQNAASMGVASAAGRAEAKASGLYENAAWDLVDASKKDDFDLDQVEEEALPAPMQQMKPEERKAYLEGMVHSRAMIQKEIQKISAKRDAYLQAERQKRLGGRKALDDAMRSAVRRQATERGFEFEKKEGGEE